MGIIRNAKPSDIPQLKPILNLPCEWDEVDPNLIVIEDTKIRGVMLLMISKPIGMIEHVVIDPDLPKKTRFRYYLSLVEFGRQYLLNHGAKMIFGFVPLHETSASRILRKYWECKTLYDCTQFYYTGET